MINKRKVFINYLVIIPCGHKVITLNSIAVITNCYQSVKITEKNMYYNKKTNEILRPLDIKTLDMRGIIVSTIQHQLYGIYCFQIITKLNIFRYYTKTN